MRHPLTFEEWSALEYHNKNTWGTLRHDFLEVISELRYFYGKPSDAKNTKWKYYVSDVGRYLALKGLKLGRHVRMPASSCYFILIGHYKREPAILGEVHTFKLKEIDDTVNVLRSVAKEVVKPIPVPPLVLPPEEDIVKINFNVIKTMTTVTTDKIDFSPCPPFPRKNLQDVKELLPEGQFTYKSIILESIERGETFNLFYNGMGTAALSYANKRSRCPVKNPVYKVKKVLKESVEVSLGVIRAPEPIAAGIARKKHELASSRAKALDKEYKINLKNYYEPIEDLVLVEHALTVYHREVTQKRISHSKPLKKPTGVRKRKQRMTSRIPFTNRLKIMKEAVVKNEMSLPVAEIHCKRQGSVKGNMLNMLRNAAATSVILCRQLKTSRRKIGQMAGFLKGENGFSKRANVIAICCFISLFSGKNIRCFSMSLKKHLLDGYCSEDGWYF